jgi:nitroreductase
MEVYEAILKRRSIRKFKNKPVSYEILEKCVNAARLAPSAMNMQPCEYIVVDKKELVEKVFESIILSSSILDKQPTAYVIILVNKSIRKEGYQHDVGLAAENIILTALENGVGSCCVGAFNEEKLKSLLSIPQNYRIDLVIALGYPDEEPVVEEVRNSTNYWYDDNQVRHVPKRKLEDVLHRNGF